jgi:hypothetical protein
MMDLSQAFSTVENRVVLVESRIKANEAWLTFGFLADDAFTPQAYLLRAECQQELRRELAAVADWLPVEFATTQGA